MNAADAGRLLLHAAAFDNRQPSRAANEAWAAALSDIPLDADSLTAVARFYGTPPPRPGERLWIQPHDIRTHRQAIRNERTEGFVYTPDPEIDDNPRAYLARRRQQIAATAAGHRPPAPQPAALEGAPTEDVADTLKGVGRTVRLDEVRRPGPHGIPCPKCSAPIGRPCRLPSGRDRGRPHPARVTTATAGATR